VWNAIFKKAVCANGPWCVPQTQVRRKMQRKIASLRPR
jgi:hypothetical protein